MSDIAELHIGQRVRCVQNDVACQGTITELRGSYLGSKPRVRVLSDTRSLQWFDPRNVRSADNGS